MRQVVNTLGDRLLGRLLRTATAGACVPEAGDLCYCRTWRIQCVNRCRARHYRHRYELNCLGQCVHTDECTSVDVSDQFCC
jgi:hypothetical protein